MKLTLSNSRDDMIVVEVRRDMRLSELKALYAWETNTPTNGLYLFHKGSALVQEGLDLRDQGITEGDMIVFRRLHKEMASSPTSQRTRSPTKAICEVELGVHKENIAILHEGRKLTNINNTLNGYKIKDGDVLVLQDLTSNNAHPNTSLPGSSGPARRATNGSNDPSQIRDLLLSNPSHMAALKENNPKLHAALKSGKLEEFASVLAAQLEERERLERKRMQLLQAHPFDIDAQRLIAEDIRRKNIEANMEAALEHNPESFGVVIMLFINCLVNGYPVKAFVDSGAQTTIMSVKCAERVNIMRLVDTRWSGVARGVGVQRIIGRVHMVDVVIEKDHLTTSFSVIEEQAMDMLLGLDMLKRHQCCIDLKKNVLRIGTTGTETPFLTESELPDFVNVSPSTSLNKRPKSSKKKTG